MISTPGSLSIFIWCMKMVKDYWCIQGGGTAGKGLQLCAIPIFFRSQREDSRSEE
jgi:hypothetical protein